MAAPTDEPEEHFVAAARGGDASAWATLVERHYTPLRRYLTARTHDPAVAADLTHDVRIAAGDSLQRLPADRLFTPWLYRIAHNHLHRLWRRQQVRRAISLDWLLGQATALPAALHAGDMAAAVERDDIVRRTLDGRSPPLRDALLLYGVAGLTAAEVAATLGISPPAAERRISRAKAQFRTRYNALVSEETM